MYRYRILYKKTDLLRFISHLDLLNTVQRAARRAGLQMVFSEGFNPHPKITFAAPLPVGVEGYKEYLEVELNEQNIPGELVSKLNNNAPRGLEFLKAKEVDKKAGPLMAEVGYADYCVQTEISPGLDSSQLNCFLQNFKDRDEILIQRKTKKGTREKNIRPGVITLEGNVSKQSIIIDMQLRTGSQENIRPDEVINILAKDYLPVGVKNLKIMRTAVYDNNKKTLLT
ncbi:MAG: TIGR03936 family radical SAM-associated protein [Clostridiales bacterium]|nr:TIGR03936 family radical SAM-associated protein [Clostridiales bacterium]MCF8022287.1 TIGR03936 family radical SAM-associated protein [Clostridiales bacterium]